MILVPHRPGLPDTTRKQTGAARTPETQRPREREREKEREGERGRERGINKINTFTKAAIVWKSDRVYFSCNKINYAAQWCTL